MQRLNRWLLIATGLTLFGMRQACAFNPITDLRENVVWTFGQAAQAGDGYNFNTNQWDASALAEIAEYRFLSFSYGGTQLNQASGQATDTFKIGFLSNFFFNWFVNKPPASMAWMENINIGPAFSIPIFSGTTGHKGVFLLDLNYRFSGGSTPPASPVSVPPPTP